MNIEAARKLCQDKNKWHSVFSVYPDRKCREYLSWFISNF